jgi:hypothetical protein
VIAVLFRLFILPELCSVHLRKTFPCNVHSRHAVFPLLGQLMWACLLLRKPRVVLSCRIGWTMMDRCWSHNVTLKVWRQAISTDHVMTLSVTQVNPSSHWHRDGKYRVTNLFNGEYEIIFFNKNKIHQTSVFIVLVSQNPRYFSLSLNYKCFGHIVS